MTSAPWTAQANGLLLDVRLTPKGGRDAIDGVETMADGRVVLKARVRAAPTDGQANDALVRLMAKTAGVPPRAVTIVGGMTSRVKRLMIAGDAHGMIAGLEKASS